MSARAEARRSVPAMMSVMALRDYAAWHDEYDRAGSPLHLRLLVVQDLIAAALDELPPGPIRVISMCAGQGRDLIGVARRHRRGGGPGRRPGRGRPAQRGRGQDGHRAGRPRRAHGHRGRRRPVRRLRRCRTRRPRPGLRHLRQRQRRGHQAHGRVPARALRSGRLGHLDQATAAGRDPAGHPGLVRGGRLPARARSSYRKGTCSAWVRPGWPRRRGRSGPGRRYSPSSSRQSAR